MKTIESATGQYGGGVEPGSIAYPAQGAGSIQPHAAQSASWWGAYSYNKNGSMTQRPVDGAGKRQCLYWNAENRLASLSAAATAACSGTTLATGADGDRYRYDQNGQRVTRVTKAGNVTTSTLYLDGLSEITKTTTGTVAPASTGPVPVHQGYSSAANGATGAANLVLTTPTGAVTGSVLIASVAASDATAAGGGTTVYSEGFESGAVGDWSPWIAPATITVTTAQARTGTKSLQMNPTATQSNSQVFPAYTAGVVNTMTGWIKGTAGGVVSPTFSSYDAAWATLNQTSGTNITLTGAWQQWTATYTVPAATAHFGISFQKLDTTAWWIDDFTITTGGAGGGTTATTTTAPAGWTAVTTSTTPGVQLKTWSHVVAAADPTSWTFTLSQTARAAGAISSYSGVDTTTPVDVSGTGTNVAGVNHVAPSVTTTGGNRLGITVTAPTAVTAMTPPSGSTERADQAGGTTAPTVSIETSDFSATTAGATGTKQTVSVTAAPSTTASIALKPAAVLTAGPVPVHQATGVVSNGAAGAATVVVPKPAGAPTGAVLIASVAASDATTAGGATVIGHRGFHRPPSRSRQHRPARVRSRCR
jgi:hypothetical protein